MTEGCNVSDVAAKWSGPAGRESGKGKETITCVELLRDDDDFPPLNLYTFFWPGPAGEICVSDQMMLRVPPVRSPNDKKSLYTVKRVFWRSYRANGAFDR